MNRHLILHILDKDLRQLWPFTLISLTVLVFYAVTEAQSQVPGFTLDIPNQHTLLPIFLVLSWWLLIAMLVHNEALAGDRQYWLTRPISWRQLLPAKFLFLVLAIHLPIFLADFAILAAHGLFPLAHLPGLLWKQVNLTAIYVLPALAFAALTRKLAEFALAWFLIAIGVVGIDTLRLRVRVFSYDDFSWLRDFALLLALLFTAAFITYRQYRRRDTQRLRVLAAAFALLAGYAWFNVSLPMEWGFTVQRWLYPETPTFAAVRLQPETQPRQPHTSPTIDANVVQAAVPVRIEGLPTRYVLRPLRGHATLRRANGQELHAASSLWQSRTGDYWISLTLQPEVFDVWKEQTVHLAAQGWLTAYQIARTLRLPAAGGHQVIDQLGDCRWGPMLGGMNYTLGCFAPLKPQAFVSKRILYPQAPVATFAAFTLGPDAHSPMPTTRALSPLVLTHGAQFGLEHGAPMLAQNIDRTQLANAQLEIQLERPEAYLYRELTIPNLRLRDWQVATP